MSSILIENSPLLYEYSPVVDLDFGNLFKQPNDGEFFDFCQRNKSMRIEMDKNGVITIMPPTGSETGKKNFKLTVKFGTWVEKDASGVGFDSSTGFSPAERRKALAGFVLDDAGEMERNPKSQAQKIRARLPRFRRRASLAN
jgi:Uma2 family endonuclease